MFVDLQPFPKGSRRAFLVGLVLPDQPVWLVEEHLEELGELVRSAGLEVAGQAIQRRQAPHRKTFIGGGKVEEITAAVGTLGADLVVFDDDLAPSQHKNLEAAFDVRVADRSALILEIFHQRAKTREARTQVQLAQLQYALPRLTKQWGHLSRQVGGIGVRGGEGEKQLEADRRILRRRISRLEKELVKIEKTRSVQRGGRRGSHMVALAGYTNAGKSTLFNLLTGGEAMAADKLFATLDSKLRRGPVGDLPGEGPGAPTIAVFADTVGFIRKLPHGLVASFKSTLEEVVHADVVLHVVDRSNPRWEEQVEVAEKVLDDLGVDRGRVLTVHNKIDRVDDAADGSAPNGPASNGEADADVVRVSAVTGEGLDALRLRIGRKLGV